MSFPLKVASSDTMLTIGVLIQDILNPFYAKIVQGIEHVLWQERSEISFRLQLSAGIERTRYLCIFLPTTGRWFNGGICGES